MKKSDKRELFASCLAGLEPLLEQELKDFGCVDVEPAVRGCSFKTDYEGMVRVNLASRFAVRVLIPWYNGFAKSNDDLYHMGKKIEWESIMRSDSTFAISFTVNSKYFEHSQYAALKLKDSIADRFRMKFGKRPSVDKDNPDLRLHLRIQDDKVLISLDSSGESLHKRGYRPFGAKAPLNECLAAGMIAFTGWDMKSPLLVPMCGSGTLVMEAAMMASNLPSQWFRPHYGFMKWTNFDEETTQKVRLELWQQRKSDHLPIEATDIERAAIRQTGDALKRIAWDHGISLEQMDFFQLPPREEPCTIILNPPYGERMRPENIEQLYRSIGLKLKNDFPGSTAWIISSNKEAYNHIGFKPSAKHTLYNGKLECMYSGFELYQGSRKEQ